MSTPPLVTGPLTTPSHDTPFVRSVRKEEEADFWIGAKEDDVGRMIRQHRHMHGDARNVAVARLRLAADVAEVERRVVVHL